MAKLDWNKFDWSSLAQGWPQDLRIAATFFTCLPLGKTEVRRDGHDADAPTSDAGLGRALRAWPVIGLAIGLAGGFGFMILRELGLGAAVAAIGAIAITVGLTGALHEDGLADFADGLGGQDPEQRLAIMRDSRLGAYGLLALLLCLGLRGACLAEISAPGHAAAALIAAEVGARGLVPLLTLSLGPARTEGLGAALGAPNQESIATAAAIGAVAALILLGPFAGLVALAASLGAIFALGTLARRRLGGYTGDVLGAAEQVGATAILLVAAIFA